MHDSTQINLPLDVLIKNNSRMCPDRVATFKCGECCFSSDTGNNHNVQFLFSYYILSIPVNPSQLQLNLNPNKTETNSPYIPFHHESSRWLKKRPIEHSNQIMYIKQLSRIFYHCPLSNSLCLQFVSLESSSGILTVASMAFTTTSFK